MVTREFDYSRLLDVFLATIFFLLVVMLCSGQAGGFYQSRAVVHCFEQQDALPAGKIIKADIVDGAPHIRAIDENGAMVDYYLL